MKRMVWILLAVFCAALGQAQSAEASGAKTKLCPCCRPSECETPVCCPASPAQPAVESSADRVVVREPARACYFFLVAPAAIARQYATPAVLRAPAANVPLFAAHCRFLI